MTVNYKPNSHRSKELTQNTEKKVEKVTTGKVVKKKNGIRNLSSALIAEEDSTNLKKYIIWDVLIPAGKKMIQETVNTILYGIGASGHSNNGSTVASRITYNSYYGRNHGATYSSSTKAGRVRTGYSFDDVKVSSRADAEAILKRMEEILDTYDIVTVSDLYELAGLPSDFPDTKYGWETLVKAEIINTGDGFMLKMPRAIPVE